MLKNLTFKLAKLTEGSAVIVGTSNEIEEGKKEQAKTITKCICKMIEGFSFQGVPDAVEVIKSHKKDKEYSKLDLTEVMQSLITSNKSEEEKLIREEGLEEISEDEKEEQDEDKSMEIDEGS